MLELKALKAEHGDCIFVKVGNQEQWANILIDCGVASTYRRRAGYKIIQGVLKEEIDSLKKRREVIDLLVVTHVDDDHIGGVIRLFEHEQQIEDLVKEIWFNDNSRILIKTERKLENSVQQGIKLKKYLEDKKIRYRNHITKDLGHIDFWWGKMYVLSPTVEQHDYIADKMEKCLLNKSLNNNYNVDIEDLLGVDWTVSQSKENDASIALLLTTNDDEKCLLLGDADINTVMQTLGELKWGKDNPLYCKWVKLAHHGSKNNFVPDFLDMVKAERFVISANGKRSGNPDKEVVAYLIDKTEAELYFNYETVKDAIFTNNDLVKYPNINIRTKLF